LIADYEFSNHPGDIDLMARLAQVSAAAFAPCVAAAGPGLFEMESFLGLERIQGFDETFARPSFIKWRAFRDSEDSRFLALALPRVLMRAPYADTIARTDGFCFTEDVSEVDRSGFLWGNAAYAFGEVAIRAFQESGWLAAVRGVEPGRIGGGLATGPAAYDFETDSAGVAPRCLTDVIITEHQERALAEGGFLPLCDLQGTGYAAFYSTQSVQKPKTYDTLEATQNAKMSSMLQYMLCVAQFARYIKLMGREFVGAFVEQGDLQRRLSNWLVKYVSQDDEAPAAMKARRPLRSARVQIKAQPDKPGSYHCSVFLQPQYELDDMSASIHLATELAGQQP
jgi:type VI secretion system ImpC/EvpB family protein